jgi:hypothetical protein
MNIGALGNANPLGAISQAMSGVGEMLKGAGSFIGNLTQMPPNLLGAIQDLCNVGNTVTQTMQGMQNATGLQMNPMEMLGNMVGVGQQGGGGGGGAQSPLAQMLDSLPSPLQMLQSMFR